MILGCVKQSVLYFLISLVVAILSQNPDPHIYYFTAQQNESLCILTEYLVDRGVGG